MYSLAKKGLVTKQSKNTQIKSCQLRVHDTVAMFSTAINPNLAVSSITFKYNSNLIRQIEHMHNTLETVEYTLTHWNFSLNIPERLNLSDNMQHKALAFFILLTYKQALCRQSTWQSARCLASICKNYARFDQNNYKSRIFQHIKNTVNYIRQNFTLQNYCNRKIMNGRISREKDVTLVTNIRYAELGWNIFLFQQNISACGLCPHPKL